MTASPFSCIRCTRNWLRDATPPLLFFGEGQRERERKRMHGIEYMILKVPLYMDVISFISSGPINATQRSHVSLTVHSVDKLT